MEAVKHHRLLFAVAFAASSVSVGCGDRFDSDGATEGAETGGASSETGGVGTQPVGPGGRSAGTGGASSETGGVGTQPVGSGGASSTSGTGGQATGGSVVTDICALVGCAAPPLCAEGCTARCGCCPCAEGEAQDIEGVKHECVGGCWAPVDAACEYLGAFYSPGATFPADDGCNECECLPEGSVSCTQVVCPPCDPDAELHVRSYMADSPEECAVIDYGCPENTTHFANDCGCGCEQAPTCPEWFDCMPTVDDSTPCDEEAIRVECPYSGIAY